MKKTIKCAISGAAAGAANGFFGAGGGMLLIPMITRWVKIDDRHAFATSVCIILPMCIASAAVYFFRGNLDMAMAWPYLLGGLLGGYFGGLLYKKVPLNLLRKALGLFIIYGGIRSFI